MQGLLLLLFFFYNWARWFFFYTVGVVLSRDMILTWTSQIFHLPNLSSLPGLSFNISCQSRGSWMSSPSAWRVLLRKICQKLQERRTCKGLHRTPSYKIVAEDMIVNKIQVLKEEYKMEKLKQREKNIIKLLQKYITIASF